MTAIPELKIIPPYLPSPSIAWSTGIIPGFTIGVEMTRAEFERDEWLDK